MEGKGSTEETQHKSIGGGTHVGGGSCLDPPPNHMTQVDTVFALSQRRFGCGLVRMEAKDIGRNGY